MNTPAHSLLIGLAISHLHQVPDDSRRTELQAAAAELLTEVKTAPRTAVTKHAHLELIGLAITHLDEVPGNDQRADLLDAAAQLLDSATCPVRADEARAAAAFLRGAARTERNFIKRFAEDATC